MRKSRVARGIGQVRLMRVPDASSESLIGFISTHVQPGARIRTDGWIGYEPLSKKGYYHEIVGSKELNIAHLVTSLLKRWLLGTYQGAVKPQQLDYYLDEYTFRFNRRTSASRGKLFYRLVQQAVVTEPVLGRNIIGGSSLRRSRELHDVHFSQLGLSAVLCQVESSAYPQFWKSQIAQESSNKAPKV